MVALAFELFVRLFNHGHQYRNEWNSSGRHDVRTNSLEPFFLAMKLCQMSVFIYSFLSRWINCYSTQNYYSIWREMSGTDFDSSLSLLLLSVLLRKTWVFTNHMHRAHNVSLPCVPSRVFRAASAFTYHEKTLLITDQTVVRCRRGYFSMTRSNNSIFMRWGSG